VKWSVQEKMNFGKSGLSTWELDRQSPPQMKRLRQLAMDRRFHRFAGALMLMGALALLLAWQMGVTFEDLKRLWLAVEGYLKENPAALFLALVILPGLPVPTSALLLTAGVVWREQPVMACLLSQLAMFLNLVWTYWLAAGPGRKMVEKILAVTPVRVPELPKGDQLKLILVMKLTPGIPLFLQNYLLGFLRAPFHLFMMVSLAANSLIVTGVVLSGAGLADGRLLPALTGVSLIVAGVVLTRLVRGWLRGRRGEAEKLKS
jgi:uncharacterized membrane protein YdjX (TVP38/TMEM64 family)